MPQVTSPIILDSTGQAIVSAINSLTSNLNAVRIGYKPNKLINSRFRINQRGWTTGTSVYNEYCADMWKMNFGTAAGTITVSSDGITLTPASNDNVRIMQSFEHVTDLCDVVLTASVMLDDGTIISGTGVHTFGVSNDFVVNSSSNPIKIAMDSSNRFNIMAYDEVKIIASKLEEGTISTLAYDVYTQKDTEQDRLACQRYALGLFAYAGNAPIGTGYAISTTEARLFLPVDVQFYNGTPSISFTGSFKFYSDGTDHAISNMVVSSGSSHLLNITLTSSGMTAGSYGFVRANAYGDRIVINSGF